jgi:hypothetical protein
LLYDGVRDLLRGVLRRDRELLMLTYSLIFILIVYC